MNHSRRLSLFSLALACSTALGFTLNTLADDKKSDDPKTLAQSILDEGAAEFGRKNAKVMARFYTEDADMRLVSRDSGGPLKTEAHHGRAEIEDFYSRLFNGNEDTLSPKNSVESARFLAHDLLAITGTFKPDHTKDIKVEFIQVRQKVGKDWLIRDIQVFYVPESK